LATATCRQGVVYHGVKNHWSVKSTVPKGVNSFTHWFFPTHYQADSPAGNVFTISPHFFARIRC